MICSSVNLDRFIVRLLADGLYSKLEEFQGLRSQADQSSKSDLALLALEQGPFDIIIDDGSHLSRHQIFAFRELFASLRQGGLYVIEDVQTSFWKGNTYGSQLDGAHIDKVEFEMTCVGYFVNMAKYLNHNEFISQRGVDLSMLDFAKQIRQITFEHNLIIIEKGHNDELSNAKKSLTLSTEFQ